jgi:hypothetical protein
MNELEKALNDVVDHGVKVIESLSPEEYNQVMAILGKVK